ncbi:MAG TPA: zinc-binding dehydrogenase [bacterium]|nr:zinc-binding dehydrogenase [bacterium]
MNAIRLSEIGEPTRLELVDLDPPPPRAGQVRLKVMAAGVNFAEVLIRRGLYLPMPALPLIPGTDAAGVIDALGEGVAGFTVGQRVVATVSQGAYAQYVVAPARAVIPLPDDIDFDLAAGLPVSGMTAWHLTRTLVELRPGLTVLNYAAAGSVGSLINGLAAARGTTVIAMAGGPEKCARALSLGATAAIDYRAERDVPARVAELTGGRGADVVYNSVMGPTVVDDLRLLAPFGRIFYFGAAAGMPNAKHLLVGLMRRFVDSPTITMYHLLAHLRHDPAAHRTAWPHLFAALRAGEARLPLHGVYPLAEAARAHDDLEQRRTMGKCVLHPWPAEIVQ